MDRLERPARTEITALLKMLARGPQATYDQRAFFLNEYLRVLSDFLELPEERIQAGDLVDVGYAVAWLNAAAAGYTRQRRVAGKPDAAAASQAARCATFNAFARHLGQPERLSEGWPDSQGLPVDESRRVVELLADNRPPRTNRSTWERTSALAALRLVTGRPLSELAGLQVSALDLKANPPTVTLAERVFPLDELAVRTMNRWLDTWKRLTEQLEGGSVTQVWVTIKPGRPRYGEPAKHPYLPCSIRALRAAQHDLTSRLLARPTRLGQLSGPDPDDVVSQSPKSRRAAPAAPPPERTAEDRALALRQAAEVRRERAEMLGRLKAGDLSLPEVLAREDRVVGCTRVGRLVESLPGVGPAARRRILAEVGVDEQRRLQSLRAQQRERLLHECSTVSQAVARG
ncbi:integration host factor, actinobacterial type [Streptomyces longwoodensis]|uniref:integration host factor, actinobacterial type n=1 Tax=Streptomyces longwoodensis TaxID=68231 RepID=UPI003403CEC8